MTTTINAATLFPPRTTTEDFPEPQAEGQAFETALTESIKADPEGAMFFVREMLCRQAELEGKADIGFDNGQNFVVTR